MTAQGDSLSDDQGRAFDFLHGRWRVHHRRLVERLAGSDEWQEFGGTSDCRPILGGLGNIDENVIDLPSGTYEAITLRTFDRTAGTWTIHWIDGRNPALDPPVIGRFENGEGLFFGEDQHQGNPVQVRFRWTVLSDQSARWEQAFSPDQGASWEVNWIMAFVRGRERG